MGYLPDYVTSLKDDIRFRQNSVRRDSPACPASENFIDLMRRHSRPRLLDAQHLSGEDCIGGDINQRHNAFLKDTPHLFIASQIGFIDLALKHGLYCPNT